MKRLLKLVLAFSLFMGFDFATGTINIGTGALNTNYSVTGKTGTWKTVILFWSGRPETTDASGETDIQPGIGVAVDATNRWAVTTQCDHSPTTTATDRYLTDAACVALLNISGAVVALADFVSFNSDGFTLIIDDVFPAALEVSYVLLGGSDLTDAACGKYNTANGTGEYDAVTSLSFVPQFVLVASDHASTTVPGAFANAKMGLGAAISSSAQFNLACRSNDAVGTSVVEGYINSSDIISGCQGAVGFGQDNRDRFVSFTPSTGNGFRLNRIVDTSIFATVYLCLRGGTYAIGNFLTATDTTGFSTAHGMSVTPKGAMFFSANRAENTVNVGSAHWEWSLGASDGTNNNCQYVRDKNASALADCFTAVSHDQCYYNADNSTTQVLEGEGHVTSFDATNINFIMSDADPTQSFVAYIAFGDAPSSFDPSVTVPTYDKGAMMVGTIYV